MDPYKWNEAAYSDKKNYSADIRYERVMPLVAKAGKVLDVGCLDGAIGKILMDHGNTVTGIDASRTAVEKARSKGLDARVGNLEEPLQFPDGEFDLVFAGEIIEHIFDVDAFLSELHRVLKPEGALVVTTPNLAALGRRLLLLMNRNPLIEISFTGNAAGHIRYFVKSTLFDLLEKRGFAPSLCTSDVVNFNSSGTVRSYWLARAFPTLGRSLIVKATKTHVTL